MINIPIIPQIQDKIKTRFETPLLISTTPYDRELPLTSKFWGFIAALPCLKPESVSTELPVQTLVYYDATMHKGDSLDNNPAKAIMLRHLGDIGEESCILDES